MYGIAGKYNYLSNQRTEETVIKAMTNILSPQGIDDSGIFIEKNLGLGHRRLIAQEVSEKGNQPMLSNDGNLVIVCDGEIYNYLELKQKLKNKGHFCRSETETEVILAMYQEHGERCLEYFNGIFAFAIWDKKERALFIARDRLGIKPLYYTLTREGISFASEVKSLLQDEDVLTSVDPKGVYAFMTFGYVPGERTIFKGINKLPAGYTLMVRPGKVKKFQYWDIPSEDIQTDIGLPAYLQAFKDILWDAVKLRLRGNSTPGAFLSGGLDSSALVAISNQYLNGPVQTFSVGYEFGSGGNEFDFSRAVANQFDTEYHELTISHRQFQSFIPRFIWYMEEPVTEASAIPLYFLSSMTGKHVDVVLSGEGAEALSGYDIYLYMRVLESYRKLPENLRKFIINLWPQNLQYTKFAKYLRLSELPLEKRYLGVSLYEPWQRDRLLSDDFKAGSGGFEAYEIIQPYYQKTRGRSILNRMLYLDTKTFLTDDLMMKADRMSRAASLKLRFPFLDHRLVEFAASLPIKYKMHGLTKKYLLKKAMAGILPKKIIYRKKLGFPTPLAMMFKDSLKDYVCEILFDSRTINRGYFKQAEVKSLVNSHMAGGQDNHRIIWQLIVLEEWHRKFIDKDSD